MGKSMHQFAFIFQSLVQVKLFLSKLQKVKEYFKVQADIVDAEGKNISSYIQFIKHGNCNKNNNSLSQWYELTPTRVLY